MKPTEREKVPKKYHKELPNSWFIIAGIILIFSSVATIDATNGFWPALPRRLPGVLMGLFLIYQAHVRRKQAIQAYRRDQSLNTDQSQS